MTAPAFWAAFGNPALQDLLQQAVAANPDLLIAANHLRIARDAALAVRAQQRPSVNLNVGPVDSAATALALPQARRQAVFELALNASYELDFWGRLSGLAASAQAEQQARAYDSETARISLMGLVAQRYFDIAQADEALALLQQGLALAAERRQLETARQAAGRVGRRPVAEAEAATEELRGKEDQWRGQRRAAEGQLALLLGRLPEGFSVAAAPLRQALHLPLVPSGLPSTLMQRRPDLRAAEARLLSAQARSGVARAERFPQIRLTGQLGVATDVLRRAASGSIGLFGFGPELSLPVYDGGSRAAQIDASDGEVDIALLEYRKVSLAAFADVENALLARQRALVRQDHIEALRQRQRDAQTELEAQLSAGRRSRLDAIADDEHRLDTELLALESYRAQLDSLLALFAALGGGWAATSGDPS